MTVDSPFMVFPVLACFVGFISIKILWCFDISLTISVCPIVSTSSLFAMTACWIYLPGNWNFFWNRKLREIVFYMDRLQCYILSSVVTEHGFTPPINRPFFKFVPWIHHQRSDIVCQSSSIGFFRNWTRIWSHRLLVLLSAYGQSAIIVTPLEDIESETRLVDRKCWNENRVAAHSMHRNSTFPFAFFNLIFNRWRKATEKRQKV